VLKDTLSPKFRALADPTRRWYLQALQEGDVRLIEFRDIFPLRPAAVLYHLRVLEESGLLRTRKEGPERLYSLLPEGFKEAAAWLQRMRWTEQVPGRRSPLRFD
jgi:DNA-binding transcriptional ArsR family regulator